MNYKSHKIKIVNNAGEFLKSVEVKSIPGRFIIYRGKLLERRSDNIGDTDYIERAYLEIN